MNALDIVFLSILVLATARGLSRGMLREVASVSFIALGIFLARRYHSDLEPYLASYLPAPMTTRAVSYLIVFFVTLTVCWLLAKKLRDTIKFTFSNRIDRVAGTLLGLAEGTLICMIPLLMLATFLPNAQFYRQSTLAHLAKPYLGLVIDALPDAVRHSIREGGFTPPGEELPELPDFSPIPGSSTDSEAVDSDDLAQPPAP